MTDNEEKQIKEVSTVVIDGVLYEEICDLQNKKACFVFYDSVKGKVVETDYVDDGDIRYVPVIDDYITKNVVILPSKAEPYVSEEQLLSDIQAHIHKYIDISESEEKICTWTIPTFWLYDKLNIMIPYLRALGDTGCGKSQFLDVIGGLSYKTMMLGGSVTPAIMYRAAEKWKGTMIIDEADWKLSDEYSEVIKIINCNQPNRRILRCKGDDYDNLQPFNPWCPRIFATRRLFGDVATESRMLTIQMKETSRDDIPVVLDDVFNKEQEKLRNQLLTYRLKNYSRINNSIKPSVDLSEVEPRGRQIIYPIAIVFSHNQDILEELVDITLERQGDLIKERASTDDGILVNAYLELLDRGKKNISSTDILEVVKMSGNKKATTRSIGHQMRSLGFSNSVKNINGKTKRCFSCDDDLLEILKKRYTVESEDGGSDEQGLQRLQRLQKYRTWFKKGLGGLKMGN